MNPIPLNDRGQFRYADFMAYLPEFLRDEPDVVQLVQLMSDYINDAYRNIEDVEKFEFKMCVAEPMISAGTSRLNELREMFLLASGRGDKVNYLSVPRANVKSNAVFGKDSGYTPYYVDVPLDSVEDEIANITRFDRKIGEKEDGDVIFVRYANIDPVQVIPYYYSQESHSLIKETEGTTQDPFTDTYNTGSRMISFNVSDISGVSSRFGGQVDGNNYYEIFFTARVYGVTSESAVQKVYFDADRVDETEDGVVIDYYGMEYVPQSTYHTTITFYDNDAWAWKSGFPTGVFYLKESSGAQLSTVDGILGRNEELLEDPGSAMASARYSLSTDAKYNTSTGLWEFCMDNPLPQSDNGRFYLVRKDDGTCAGEFMMVPDQSIDGKFTSMMSAVWVSDDYLVAEAIPASKAFLMNFPLFYDKGVPDYGKAKPRVRLELADRSSIISDWRSVSARRFVPMQSSMTAIGAFRYYSDDTLGEGKYLGRNQFIIPQAQSLKMKVGDMLFSDGVMWSGLNMIDSMDTVHYMHGDEPADGVLVTMRDYISSSIPDDTDITLFRGVDLIFTTSVDSAGKVEYRCRNVAQMRDILSISTRSTGFNPESLGGFIEYRVEGNDSVYYGRIVDARDTGDGVSFRIDPDSLDGMLPGVTVAATIYVASDLGSIRKLGDITNTEDKVVEATCDKYSGDIYTNGMLYIWDGAGNYTFGRIGDYGGVHVLTLQYGVVYYRGDVVYDMSTGHLYECTGNCMLAEGERLANSDYFRINMVARAKTGYSKVYNKFMPYAGPVRAMDYGERIDYESEMHVATAPLYILKIAENRLKYGWEHREFLNYGSLMNMSGRERNGSVDIFSSASSDPNSIETGLDIVTSTLDKKARWHIAYPVVKRDVKPSVPVDVDNPVSLPAEFDGELWEVTVSSAGHGLVEGCLVRVYGFGLAGELDINGYYPIHVVDGDTISFSVSGEYSASAGDRRYISINEASSIIYVGEYWMATENVAKLETAGMFQLGLTVQPRGIHVGDVLKLIDLDADISPAPGERAVFDITVSEDGSSTDKALTFVCEDGAEELERQLSHEFQIRRVPSEGDYVYMNEDSVYLVKSGAWEAKEINDIAVPAIVLSRHNMMDVSETNPMDALGDTLVIDRIIGENDNSAIVRMKDAIGHFTQENASIIENRTMVYINNVTPSAYNGWHTVTEVISPKAFRIGVRFADGTCTDGMGLNGGEMILREGRWYAYTVDGISWDKISNQVTFSLNNVVNAVEGTVVTTEKEHGLSAGDFVIVGSYDDIVSVDAGNAGAAGERIMCYRVSAVLSKYKIKLADPLTGNPVDCTGLRLNSIARGVKITNRMDDVGVLSGEYTLQLETYGGASYRFRNGDLVVLLAQQNPVEIKTWRVCSSGSWYPVRAKRSMKISSLGVYSYRNGEFDGAVAESGEDALKYDTYSDVDVAGFDNVYTAGYRCVSKAKFTVPALDDMDTTMRPQVEYSSGEDFSNISPRHDMKTSFRGVPAMKYPLVEKIERLCYLRDARVIDFELIEYLARFLGYDITAMADDVRESSLYSTWRDRENAIRETVANLPQYYALGGTKAGLHMLMSTFGIISDAITLWTDAEHPYKELIHRDEVVERVENGEGGKWVPTPYIDIVVSNHARYPQFALRQSDVERVKEQIRVFKPINVVFRDFSFRLIDTIEMKPMISMVNISSSANLGAIGPVSGEPDVEYLPEELSNCSF